MLLLFPKPRSGLQPYLTRRPAGLQTPAPSPGRAAGHSPLRGPAAQGAARPPPVARWLQLQGGGSPGKRCLGGSLRLAEEPSPTSQSSLIKRRDGICWDFCLFELVSRVVFDFFCCCYFGVHFFFPPFTFPFFFLHSHPPLSETRGRWLWWEAECTAHRFH